MRTQQLFPSCSSMKPSWEVRYMTAANFNKMFRRIWRCLFPSELDSCFRCVFKRNRATDDEDLEKVCMEVTTEQSKAPALLMARLEETYEPEKTQNSTKILNRHQNQDNFYDNYPALVEKLSAEKSLASRIAACRILYAFYENVSPQSKDWMWNTLSRLSVDEDIQVRRMVITILANIAKDADKESYLSYIIPILEKLARDEKAEHHLEATQLVIYIATWPDIPEDARQAIIPVLLKQSRHPSWEVRYMIANNINEIQEALQAYLLNSGLIAVLPNLMKDHDLRVRDAADNQFLARCS